MGETLYFLGNAFVVFLIESYDYVFEVSEDVLLAYFDLPSSLGLCAFETEITERTDKVIFSLSGDRIQVEDLSTL